MGKPSKSMFLMIFYYIAVRIPLAYLLSYLGFGLNGIWVAVLVSHVVASVTAFTMNHLNQSHFGATPTRM